MTNAQLTSLSDVHRIWLQTISEQDARLDIAECQTHVPFTIRRAFVVTTRQENVHGGHHAHRSLHQFLICISGVVDVVVDDGSARDTHSLTSPDYGLYVPPGIWAEQVYRSKGAILLVLCNEPYDATEYIRDQALFLSFKRV